MTVGRVIENSKPSSPTGRSRFRGRGMRIGLRAAVGVLIVVLLLVRADAHALIDSLRHADAREVALAFLVLLAGLVVNAFRWQLFLRPLGLALPGRTLVRLTFVGTFFNAFFPTGFGGDAYKSFRLRGPAGMAPPLATAVLDRLAGLAGLAFLGLAGCAWRLAAGHGDRVVVVASILGVGVLTGSAVALLLAPRWSTNVQAARVGSKLGMFGRAFATAGREPQAVRWGTVLGVVSALLLVAVNALLADSLRISLPVAALPAIVLIATLTTALPFSINGLGFREAAYVWCLASYGIGHDRTLAFALLVLTVTLASSVVGGIVYALVGGEVPDRS
ncbi:MAG: lysylphosphatidylglycerol synthase transmembrane domain-containing protein [Actinomycetota bacterium]